MPQKQNPTAMGDRALWNALQGVSTEPNNLFAYRAQHLIAVHGVRPQLAAVIAALAFGGGDHG